MMRRAVLIDDRDNRLGTVDVNDATFVVRHGGATFVRTDTGVKLRPSHRMLAVVFQQTEVYVRDKLDAI
jgi:hypothetical protein